jgi:hypothetical protein
VKKGVPEIGLARRELLPEQFRIFYSWQSDLPNAVNRSFIEKCLSLAVARVKEDLPDDVQVTFHLDAATKGRSGSVDIANAILEKIDQAHAIVADVSTVAKVEHRAFPNPNVGLETGYAGASIGWGRVVGVVNKAFGDLTADVPFDLRGRRLVGYSLAQDGDKATAKTQLTNSLYFAIRAIIEAQCRGELPMGARQLASAKRMRDIRLVTRVMSQLHRPTVDRFIDEGRNGHLWQPILTFSDGFRAMLESPQFRLYDKQLEVALHAMDEALDDALDLTSTYYQPTGDPRLWKFRHEHLPFTMKRDLPTKYRRLIQQFNTAYRQCLNRIHQEYPEIDLDTTDRTAGEK